DAAQRIAGPVVAERDELVGLADRGRERDATRLVLALAQEADRPYRVAFGQDQERLRQRNRHQRLDQPQRVGPRDREPLEPHVAAAQRRELDRDLGLAGGGDRRQRRRRDLGAAGAG